MPSLLLVDILFPLKHLRFGPSVQEIRKINELLNHNLSRSSQFMNFCFQIFQDRSFTAN